MKNPLTLLSSAEESLRQVERDLEEARKFSIPKERLAEITQERNRLTQSLKAQQLKILDSLGELAEAVGVTQITMGERIVYIFVPKKYLGSNFLVYQQLSSGTPTTWPTSRILEVGFAFSAAARHILERIEKAIKEQKTNSINHVDLIREIGERIVGLTTQ